MSRMRSAATARMSGFPRVSGDEPRVSVLSEADHAFSPRERG